MSVTSLESNLDTAETLAGEDFGSLRTIVRWVCIACFVFGGVELEPLLTSPTWVLGHLSYLVSNGAGRLTAVVIVGRCGAAVYLVVAAALCLRRSARGPRWMARAALLLSSLKIIAIALEIWRGVQGPNPTIESAAQAWPYIVGSGFDLPVLIMFWLLARHGPTARVMAGGTVRA